MTPPLQRIARAPAAPYVLLATLVLAHRLLLFAQLHQQLDNLIALHSTLLTWQFLPASILQDHLLRGLCCLQQTPPLPHVVLGLLLKGWAFPHATAHALAGAIAAGWWRLLRRGGSPIRGTQ